MFNRGVLRADHHIVDEHEAGGSVRTVDLGGSEMLAKVATAFSRAYGHFAVMLDADLQVTWASETMPSILGCDIPVGATVIDYLHPDDLSLAMEGIGYHNENAHTYASYDPGWMPVYSSVRLAHATGHWVRTDVTIFNFLADPELGCFLAIGRRGQDRTDLALAIDLLGSGASLDEVLPVVARLVDRTFDGCRTQVLWWDDTHDAAVAAPDSAPLPDPPAGLLAAMRSTGEPQQIVGLLKDRRGVEPAAAAGGFDAVWVVPVTAPGRDEVVGALVLWCELAVNLVMGPQQPVHQAVRLASLAIVDHHAKTALRWDATHDGLTGLLNRTGFNTRVTADHMCGALLYIDLDDFKPINDRFGHEAGDDTLVEMGRRIAAVVREGDPVARLGGDEFAVLCPGLLDPAEAGVLAHRVIDAICRPLDIGGERVSLGASAGVAIGAHLADRFNLLRRADEALYRAKAAGKRQVAFADPAAFDEA